MKIGFDLQGGDNDVNEAVEALKAFVSKNQDVELVVYLLEDFDLKLDESIMKRVNLVYAKELIKHDDSILAVRRKKDSTLIKALNDLKEDKIDALVSAGASGPLVSASYLIIKTIDENIRPAFSPMYLGFDNRLRILVDAGANIDVELQHMIQFAKMGNLFYKIMANKTEAKIGLLNIGVEEKKGIKLYVDTFNQLKEWPNFVGNIEANRIMEDDFDVLVADGFNGNIVSKAYEGALRGTGDFLKAESKKSFLTKLGFFISKKAFRNYKALSTSEVVSGALVLGLNKLVFKAHGSSDRLQLENALILIKRLLEQDLIKKIKEEV